MNFISSVKILSFLAVFCVFILNASGHIESIDGMGSLNVARNIAYNHNFSIAPPEYNTGMNGDFGQNGMFYSIASFGYTLVMLPAAYLTRIIYDLNKFTPGSYFPLQSDYLLGFFASFANPILGFLLFYVDYKLYKEFTRNSKEAFLVSLITSFTTNLLALSKHSFAHVLFTLLFVTSLFFLVRYFKENKFRNLIFSGLLGALLVIAYNLTCILPLAILSIYYFYKTFNIRIQIIEEFKRYLIWVALVSLGGIVLLSYNWLRFGDFFNFGFTLNGLDFALKPIMFEGLWGLLLSPGKSILVYSPVFALCIYYAFSSFKKKESSKMLLLVTTIYVIFYARYAIWSGELSYGPRYMTPILPFFGLVLVENWKRVNKYILGLFVLLGLYVQLVGSVIPYQTQYPPYDLKIYSEPKEIDREVAFQIYGMGEFWPRFSPPYRLKRVLLRRLADIPDIMLSKRNSVDFANNVSTPIYPEDYGVVSGKPYAHALSSFYMYSNVDKSFQNIRLEVGSINQPIKSLKICIKENCILANNIERDGNKYIIKFDKSEFLPKNNYVNFVINEDLKKKNDFELDLYSFSFDSDPIDLTVYRVLNKDNFFTRGTINYIDNTNFDYLWKVRNNDFEGLNNITPDFWWIKAKVYYNLPPSFLIAFYSIVVIFILSIALLLVLVGKKYVWPKKK